MQTIPSLLAGKDVSNLSAALQKDDAAAHELSTLLGMIVYERSVVAKGSAIYCLARKELEKLLCVLWIAPRSVEGFSGNGLAFGRKRIQMRGLICPRSEANASALRETLSFCAPQLLDRRRSFGAGDRLGIATPAHVRAIRGTGVSPIFAQQSIREMERTGRSPQQVIDSATWGVFEEGWRDGFGSDADHLKRPEDIDRCAAAGFTMFTIDPGDHVDNEAQSANAAILAKKFDALPWAELESTVPKCRKQYAGKISDLAGGVKITLSEQDLMRAAAKYGKAIAHTVKMYRHLVTTMGNRPFELEMSVDETATPTTPAEHYFVAAELKRLGVKWVSLAPRFVGDFEKGIDYKGSLDEFERRFVEHVAIAAHLGPYKISLHSGSDKFSVYAIAARCAGDLLHVKTAGTSYLEALRAVATVDPGLFREILAFAFERYDTDRATYHVSATTSQVRRPEQLKDNELASVLDVNAGRQLLHVTYGSVLTAREGNKPRFKDRILTALKQHEEIHYDIVAKHIRRHVDPISYNR